MTDESDPHAPPDDAPYRDPDRPTAERVDDLLERMTPDEKIGQLLVLPETGTADEIRAAVGDLIREAHLGQVSPIGRVGAPDDPAVAVELVNDLQRIAIEETRLGIPILPIANAVHGHAFVDECAAFPHNLGIAASRDRDLVERTGAVTARELAATGIRVNYGPVVDVGRDPRWGRTFETFGESTYLCGELGAASVRGHRRSGESLRVGDGTAVDGPDDRVRTTIKHFPGYGEPLGGEDAGVHELSEASFRRMHLPAYARALAAGADDVMPSYSAIGGEPVHGSARLVDDLLRSSDAGAPSRSADPRAGPAEADLAAAAFDGLVVSDYDGTGMLDHAHRTAESMREAVRQSFDAGVDAFLHGEVVADYPGEIRSLLDAGDLPEARLDEAVRRVLRAKIDLGLFEDPYTDPDRATDEIGTPAARDVERETARRSLTLLENDGDLLPLSGEEDVLLAGPAADDVDFLLGGWSRVDGNGTTIREGLAAALESGARGAADAADRTGSLTYERGAGIREPDDPEAAVAAAEDADVAVVALGDGQYIHEFGLSPHAGETGAYPTRTDLELPDAQRDLLEAIHGTGTPTVGVLVAGRPPAIPWAAEHVPALLLGFYPGARGGEAIADVLLGEAGPAGALPISIPRSTGHLPERFNHYRRPTPIGPDQHPDTYDPLYPFGHGCHYTDFEVRDLDVAPATVDVAAVQAGVGGSANAAAPGTVTAAPDAETAVSATDTRAGTDADGVVTVAVTVENVGDRAGTKPIDAFVSDRCSSRVTPIEELRAFDAVGLDAGEERRVALPVDVATMGVRQPDGTRRVEPGEFDVRVGTLETSFAVE